jgi:hypothetical protein
MNAGPEDFEGVIELIALKRYEQPPPGYFNRLPGKILARIEAEEVAPGFWERLAAQFALKPATAYAFGLALCGVFVVGIGYSLQTDMEESAALPLADESWRIPAARPVQPLPLAAGVSIGGESLRGNELSSTNPVAPGGSLMIDGLQLRVQPASYSGGY